MDLLKTNRGTTQAASRNGPPAPTAGGNGRGKQRPARAAGFSLAEMLVAMTILVFVFAAVFRGTILTVRMQSDAVHRNHAAALINEEMEYLRSLSWTALAALGSPSDFTSVPTDPGLSGQREFNDLNGLLRGVRLTVTWVDPRGITREEVAISAIRKPD